MYVDYLGGVFLHWYTADPVQFFDLFSFAVSIYFLPSTVRNILYTSFLLFVAGLARQQTHRHDRGKDYALILG